jgi:uncharacterized protein YbjT (DUF2867 family)
MRVVVFGGSGFIGRHCVEALREAGHQVSAPSHSDCDLCDFGMMGGMAIDGALNSVGIMWGANSRAELVVNTVGIKREGAGKQGTWEAVHVKSVRNLIKGMERNGVRRLIHITVAGLAADQSDPYSVTKRASQEAIEASELSAIVLQPGVVWGRGDDFARNLAAGILHAPVFPTLAPAGKLAVVHVADVAAAVVAAAARLRDAPAPFAPPRASCACYDVVGPAARTLPELQAVTAAALGLSCVSVPVPAALMVPAAALVERLMVDPPITTAQLGLLRRGVLGSLDETRGLLAREPRPYTADGVKDAVEAAKPLFGVSVRPMLRVEVAVVLLALLAVAVWW